MFTVQVPELDSSPLHLATAEEAMEAVNRLRVWRVGSVIITTDSGAVLTECQLAMLAMDAKLRRTRKERPAPCQS